MNDLKCLSNMESAPIKEEQIGEQGGEKLEL